MKTLRLRCATLWLVMTLFSPQFSNYRTFRFPWGTLEVKDPRPWPPVLSLVSAYPNLFNPSTTLHYPLSARSHVTLAVYDLLGRRVAALVDGVEEAGEKSVRFVGGQLSSGICLYRVVVGNGPIAGKLLLLR
jgi:hypothetical protein